MTDSDQLIVAKKLIHDEWAAKLKRHASFKLVYDKMIAHDNAGGPRPTAAEFEEWRAAIDESLRIRALTKL